MGLVIAVSMARHATFTGTHQGVTAGAALVALWLCIGVIAGLTVLSPAETDPTDAPSERPHPPSPGASTGTP